MVVDSVSMFFMQAVECLRNAVTRGEEGQSMVEYALWAALISITAFVVILLISPQL